MFDFRFIFAGGSNMLGLIVVEFDSWIHLLFRFIVSCSRIDFTGFNFVNCC